MSSKCRFYHRFASNLNCQFKAHVLFKPDPFSFFDKEKEAVFFLIEKREIKDVIETRHLCTLVQLSLVQPRTALKKCEKGNWN